MGLKETSKFISLILRHRPEAAGITLDEHGWADVQELIRGINAAGRHHLDEKLLELIVRTDEKQRYSFNEDHTLIRANQGHSIPVDVELEKIRKYVRLSFNLRYIPQKKYQVWSEKLDEIGKMLGGWLKTVNSHDRKA